MIDLTGPVRPWSERLRRRFGAAVEHGLRSSSWWHSPGPRGELALLERLTELFGAPPGRTIVTSGVRQFAAVWAGRTAGAVVETPTFIDIPAILASRSAGRRLPWEAMANGAPADGGSATIWLTSPFRNPDGRSLDARLLRSLDALAGRGDAVVVNQVYRWFGGQSTTPVAPATAWTVTSLAKLAGGGLRLGWVTAPDGAEISQDLTSSAPPTAWQRAWAAFLDPPTFSALWHDCVEPTIEARAAFATRAAQLCEAEVPTGGMLLMLDCLGLDEDAGVSLLASHGIAASPGRAFDDPAASVRLAFSGVTRTEAIRAAEILVALGKHFRVLAPDPHPGFGRAPLHPREEESTC